MSRKRGTPPLTEKQREAMEAIREFGRRHGYWPTVRELAEAMGIPPSTAHDRMVGLMRLGLIGRPKPGAKRLFVGNR